MESSSQPQSSRHAKHNVSDSESPLTLRMHLDPPAPDPAPDPDPDYMRSVGITGSDYLMRRDTCTSPSPSFYEILGQTSPVEKARSDDEGWTNKHGGQQADDEHNAADTTMMSTESLLERGVPLADTIPLVDPASIENDNDYVENDHVDDDDDLPEKKGIISKNARKVHLASILLFVLGSILYLVCAVLDYQWAQELQTLPLWLRTSDDDVAWMNYRLEEQQNNNSSSLLFNRSIRRMKSRGVIRLLSGVEVELEGEYGVSNVKQTETRSSATGARDSKTSRHRRRRRLQTNNPEEPYEDLDWVNLPPNIQAAYITLGYNQALWDGGGEVLAYDLDWIELSDEQREAVLLLGYTQEIWCIEDIMLRPPTQKPITVGPTMSPSRVKTPMPVTSSPTTMQPTLKPVTSSPTQRPTLKPLTTKLPTPKPTSAFVVNDNEVPARQWWADIDPGTQNLFTSLGYDEQSWNNGLKVPVDDKSWDEMDFVERLALYSIGYTEESWNAIGPGQHFPSQPSWPTPSPATESPTLAPATLSPTKQPTNMPVSPTKAPTLKPVTESPTRRPVSQLVVFTRSPTAQPTHSVVTEGLNTSAFPEETVSSTPDELYNDEWWIDLPVEIQEAYAVLGYNEEIWNGGMEPESNEMDWVDLSPEMKEAATFIGYTPDTWDTEEETTKPTMTPTKSLLTPAELYYDELWADLPPEIQDAYSILGYNEDMWNDGVEPISDYLAWPGLTDEEREAALFIGYTEESWELEDNVPTAKPTMKPTNDLPTIKVDNVEAGYYDDFDWVELPAHVQEAAAWLGYDQKLWDANGLAWSEAYSWDELTPEAQKAAAILGYDKQSWDGEDSSAVGYDDYISYDDDFVFQVGTIDGVMVWVSRYQIIFFFAALCFVLVGLLDLVREKRAFHIMMILAGIFGVISAVYVEEDIYLSNVFNCVSVHLFLLEALTLFGEHKRSAISVDTSKLMKWSVMLADLEFAAGALIDVIVSYVFLFDGTADWDTSLVVTDIFAAVLWLNCSLIYLGVFFFFHET